MTSDVAGGGPTEADARLPGPDPDPNAEADAARRVLAGDGRGFVLLPWQIAYLVALTEGRPGFVPPGCGVGKGWLEARLRDARATGDSASL